MSSYEELKKKLYRFKINYVNCVHEDTMEEWKTFNGKEHIVTRNIMVRVNRKKKTFFD